MSRTTPRPVGYHWDLLDPISRSDGHQPCRWCKGPVLAKRRTRFCSAACVLEWEVRINSSKLRRRVRLRDKGVCKLCGLDTSIVKAQFTTCKQAYGVADAIEIVTDQFQLHPILAKHLRRRRGLWQMDHIIPVSQGGDWFDMRNLQTACIPCHITKTSAEATERAGRRRTN